MFLRTLLKDHIEHRKISAAKLAKQIGLTPVDLSRFLKGKELSTSKMLRLYWVIFVE